MSNPFKQASNRRLPPFPGNRNRSRASIVYPCPSTSRPTSALDDQQNEYETHSGVDHQGFTPDFVKSYLASHDNLLEDYVMESVGVEQLDNWMRRKKHNQNASPSLDSLMAFRAPVIQPQYVLHEPIKVQQMLLEQIYSCSDYLPMLYEMTNVLGTAIKSDSCSMYATRAAGNELHLYVPPADEQEYRLKISGPICLKTTVSAHAAFTRETVILKDLLGDERFPRGVGVEGSLMHSVLCIPVCLPTEDLLCVMEFTRNWDRAPFGDVELQTSTALVGMVGATMYQCQVNQSLTRQADLNDFLLEVSKIIFDDLVAVEQLVQKIMTYTKDLVQADRCALFLMDHDVQEMYSTLLDEGQLSDDGKPLFTRKEIRFSVNDGIAGSVARSGMLINIPDAYRDSRFNREVDKQTGYTTESILCMPILSKGAVIGVVQMINKRMSPGYFTKTDESSFKMFAVYCAMALHYSKIYMDLKLQQAHFRVSLEQISYHSAVTEDEYRKFRPKAILHSSDVPVDLDSFYFYGPENHELLLPQLFIKMLFNMFGPRSFELDSLTRFVLTIKKNYRPVSYHNWKHGWNVAHCMYCFLLRVRDRNIISELRMKALIVASLCHDVDHRGFNNAFFTKFNEPLATLYQSSVMEQHHYATTINLLQQPGHNIFDSLSTEDYKSVLEYMRHAIIATDLALYFPNQKQLSKLALSGSFDYENPEHMDLSIACLMSMADLSAVCKPWNVAIVLVRDLYKEFWVQGDMEKELGVDPIAMMDRDNQGNLPKDQVGFIKFVCLPCYQTLSDIFPETKPLYEGCRDNEEQWQRMASGKSTKIWEPSKSVPTPK